MNTRLMKTCQTTAVSTALIFLLFFTGCTITREATLREAHVKGAINLPPVHLAKDIEGGAISITPHLNYTPLENFKTNVEPEAYSNSKLKNGESSTDYLKLSKAQKVEQMDFSSGENLIWEIPKVSGGFDLEVFISRGFGITGSFNFASGGSNGSVGLALQSVQKGVGVRFDGGLLFNNFSYEAYSIVQETTESIFGSESATYYFHDAGSSNSTNFYIFLTFNSANDDNLLGFLVSLGYFRQTILDYNAGNLDDGYYLLFPPLPVVINNYTRLKSTVGFFNLLPAIFTNLTENIKLIGGVRMNTEIEIGAGDIFFWPFIQTEFSF